MSYILDALKKLERKKQQEAAPGLMTEHTAVSPVKSRKISWPLIIILLLVINAVIMSVWIFSTRTDSTPEIETQNDHKKPPPEDSPDKHEIKTASSENATVRSDPVDSKPEEQPSNSIQEPAHERPDEPVKHESEKAKAKAVNEFDDTNTMINQDNLARDFLPSGEALDSLKHTIRSELKEVAGKDSSAPDKSSGVASSAVNVPVHPVKEYSQLPDEVKKELPDITLSGHIYSDIPSARIVNINGVIVREGETVATGLKVDEITPSGVIFSYKNERFRLRAF